MIVLTRRKTNILSRSKRLIEASKSSILIKFLQLIILKAMLIPFLHSKVLEHAPFQIRKDFLILESDHFFTKTDRLVNKTDREKLIKRMFSMTLSSCFNQLLMGSMFVYLHMDKLVPARPSL